MKSQYVLPITIVVAGALIAGAVFLIGKQNAPTNSQTNTQFQADKAAPVTSSDHILGNPNALVKVIEYADLECPYCKEFQTTMNQIMGYYGPAGKVAWIFRAFPLAQIHSKAPEEAQAAECAADQGGNQAFFNYIDKVYAITPSENNLDLSQLPIIAGEIGLNVATFNQCLSSGKFASKVQQSYNDAINAGGQGTPFILVSFNGGAIPLEGAQPYDSMRAVIDAALAQLPASSGATTTVQ